MLKITAPFYPTLEYKHKYSTCTLGASSVSFDCMQCILPSLWTYIVYWLNTWYGFATITLSFALQLLRTKSFWTVLEPWTVLIFMHYARAVYACLVPRSIIFISFCMCAWSIWWNEVGESCNIWRSHRDLTESRSLKYCRRKRTFRGSTEDVFSKNHSKEAVSGQAAWGKWPSPDHVLETVNEQLCPGLQGLWVNTS